MRIGLAVIVGAEVDLIDKFISDNDIFNNFVEVKFLCDNSTDGTIEKLRKYEETGLCEVYERDLNLNFSKQRNFLNDLMESEYILRLDIDEIMSDDLIDWVKHFDLSEDEDLYIVTRHEKIEGKTIKYFPIQFVYKKSPVIKWKNDLHETLKGYTSSKNINSRCLLIHDKSESRCSKQNRYYYDNYTTQREIVDGGKE